MKEKTKQHIIEFGKKAKQPAKDAFDILKIAFIIVTIVVIFSILSFLGPYIYRYFFT